MNLKKAVKIELEPEDIFKLLETFVSEYPDSISEYLAKEFSDQTMFDYSFTCKMDTDDSTIYFEGS